MEQLEGERGCGLIEGGKKRNKRIWKEEEDENYEEEKRQKVKKEKQEKRAMQIGRDYGKEIGVESRRG